MAQVKLDKAVFKYIEHELYDYPETKKAVKRLREEIMYGSNNEEPIGGGRPSEPGRPTERMATRLASSRNLVRMQMVVDAVETSFEQLPDDHKKVVQLKYWDRRRLTMEGIASECFMHRNTAAKYRREFVYLVAERMGYILPAV